MPPRACGPGARSTRSRWRASRRCSISGSGTRSSARRLSVISSVYKIVHFDAPHVQRAMGARPKPPLPVTEPRWAQQVHAAESWTGGDVECDVVVIGTGAGGAVVGHALAARGHAVAFVEEGQLYHRHSFDGSTVRAYERFYRPVFALGNATFPIFVGRMVGGSTADQRRDGLPDPGPGAGPLVRGDGHRRPVPRADGGVLRAGGDPPRRGSVVAPGTWGPSAR